LSQEQKGITHFLLVPDTQKSARSQLSRDTGRFGLNNRKPAYAVRLQCLLNLLEQVGDRRKRFWIPQVI